MMSFVRGDRLFSNTSRSKPNSLASRNGIGTGVAPTKLMTDS